MQSATADPPSKQKRRRNVLSCVECHRRKEKCNRQLPCNSCIARPGAICLYESPKLHGDVRPMRMLPRATIDFTHDDATMGMVLASEAANFVPAGMYPLGSPRFMSIWESRWTPTTAACPLIMQSTSTWANNSLEALKGVPGSREAMWHRGKVLGLTANRINHLGHFLSMSEDLAKAIVLLAQVELTSDDAEAASEWVQALDEIISQCTVPRPLNLKALLRDFVIVADAVVAYMLDKKPFLAGVKVEPSRRYFECRLLASSPLSPLAFSDSSYILRFETNTASILFAMKELCNNCTNREPVETTDETDDTCADFQSQPVGVETVIATTSAMWTRSVLRRIPFSHPLNTLDRLTLFDSLYAIDNIEEAFRYMPGVLIWILLTACSAVGSEGYERRFLLQTLQRWTVAVCFCTSAGAIVEMVHWFRQIEHYVTSVDASLAVIQQV